MNTQRRSIDRLLRWEFWAIASQTGLLRKPHPTLEHLNGMSFPVEASSGNCSPESALRLGCNFPMGPSGKLRPESALETGRGFPEDRNSRPPLDKMIRSLRRMRNIQGVSQGAGTIGTSPAAGGISPQQQKPALATNVTCVGLAGAHEGTLQRPTSVMHYRTAPARDASVGLPSDEACRSLRQSAQCRQSADTAK